MLISRNLQAASAFSLEQLNWDLDYLIYDPDAPGSVAVPLASGLASISDVRGIQTSPDGLKMYLLIAGGTVAVQEYTLTSPWDITSMSLATSLDISGQGGSPAGLHLSPDGTKLYHTEGTSDSLYEYTLSMPFDLSTATYVQGEDVSAQDTSPAGVAFKTDGTAFYIGGAASQAIFEYSLSAAWDISTATYSRQFSLGGAWFSGDLFIDSSGTSMYLSEYTDGKLRRYTLVSPWDISSATLSETSAALLSNLIMGSVDPNGLYAFVSRNDTQVYRYLLGGSLLVTARGIALKPDGAKLYLAAPNTGFIHDLREYDLSSPWDVSTASFVQDKSVTGVSTASTPVFKPDGTKVFITDVSLDAVIEVPLSSAWDISSAGSVTTFSLPYSQPLGLYLSPDGTYMFATTYVDGTPFVYRYILSSAWDVSTASVSGSLNVTSQTSTPRSVSFKPDGTKMFVGSGTLVFEYDVGTPWDLSTASYSKQAALLGEFFIRPDGSQAVSSIDAAVVTYSFRVR